MNLREVCTPLLAYILLAVRTSDKLCSFTELRRDITRLLEEQGRQVKRHDIGPQDYDSARFAVIAWIDELMLQALHQSYPEICQQWKHSPLQVEIYETANAGEEFFERLERLGPAHSAVREIYHLCLCLGFRGRYYDDSQQYKLVALRREVGQHLPAPVPDLLELEKRQEHLTPQPYAVQPPPHTLAPRSYAVVGTALVAALCAMALVYLLWPVPGRSRAEIIADLEERIGAFTCCRVAVVDFQDRTGTVRLAGRVDSQAQGERIRQAVQTVPEVKTVQDTFSILPRPFCEVVDLLEPFHVRNADSGFNLSVHPQKGCEATYRHGENLVVSIAAHKPLQYIYVDYYVADRSTVAHLLPSPRQPDNDLQTDTAVTLGGPTADTRWEVQPPFGMEMVTAVSSPQPLDGPPRPATDGVSAYLDHFRKALQGGQSTDIMATYCLITTEDQ